MEESVRSPSGRQYACTYGDCTMVFSRPNRLAIHERTHTGERPYACEYADCTKSYVRKMHLDRHIQTSHQVKAGVEIFICANDGCLKEFETKCGLDKHAKSVHQDPDKYRCPEQGCNKAFHKKHQLRAHGYEHNGVLPFQCEVEGCNRQFKQSSHLIRHKKSHSLYSCDVQDCSEAFEKWSLLREHKAKKHGKKHTCEICQKSYPRPALLAKHAKIHETDTVNMYKCSFEGCSRMYSEIKNLKSHIRSFHENKKFKCDECGQELVNKSKLRQHLQQHFEQSPEAVKKQYPKKGHRKKSFPEKMVNLIMKSMAPVDSDTSELDMNEDTSHSEHLNVSEQSVEQIFKRAEMETVNQLNSTVSETNTNPFSDCELSYKEDTIVPFNQPEKTTEVEQHTFDELQSMKTDSSQLLNTDAENEGDVMFIDINDMKNVTSIIPYSAEHSEMDMILG